MVHGGIFTIQEVFFIHCFNMQNVQSNVSLSRGKIKLQEKSISPKEVPLESLSFFFRWFNETSAGISQLLWVNSQLLWPSAYLSLAGSFMKQHMGRVISLATLSVIRFWAVFLGKDIQCFTFKTFDVFLTTASMNDGNWPVHEENVSYHHCRGCQTFHMDTSKQHLSWTLENM